MSSLPTKPLLCARFTLLNTTPYTADQLMSIFKPDLEKGGIILYQTPSVRTYTAKFTITKEGPFPDDEAKSVFETMLVDGPAGKGVAIAKDLTNDPAGTRPILEKRLPIVTAVTWNLGHTNAQPAGKTWDQHLSDLLWQIRRSRVYNSDKYTGLGWTPVVLSWEKAPVKLSPYPDRPPIPGVLQPVKPPAPKPPPAPPPYVPPAPPPYVPPAPPAPINQASMWGDWRIWVGAGAVALLLFSGDKKPETKKRKAA